MRFCHYYRFQPFPISEFIIKLFVVHLARRNLAYRSIKVYLCGVQFHSLMQGFPIKLSSLSYLYYVMRGIRRTQGDSLMREPRSPITVSHLWLMFAFISSSKFSAYDKALWKYVTVIAFFGLLRVSEQNLTAKDI